MLGNVGSIVRIHAFLEQWGLINFQAAGTGIQQPKAVSAMVNAATSTSGMVSVEVRPSEITCSVCSVVCTADYYYRNETVKKTGSVTVCPLCYGEGRFPADLSSVDFVHIDTVAFPTAGSGLRSNPFTDSETMILLDALEKQGEGQPDWEAVAQAVGRPKDQCVLQFLKLPTIESTEAQASPETSLVGFPFGQVENPVMSTVAFLASLVHPKVAAAAARAAIDELTKNKSTAMDIDGDVAQEQLQEIAGAALGSAAAHSALLAADETKRLARLREVLVELQLQKIKSKLALFEDLEKGLEADKKDVEQQRLQLFIDRFNLRKMMLKSQQNAKPAGSDLTKL